MNNANIFEISIRSGNYILEVLNSNYSDYDKKNIRDLYKLLTVVVLENEDDPKVEEVRALVEAIREKWSEVFSDNIDGLNSNNNNIKNNKSIANSRINNFNANTANFEGNNIGNANLHEYNANSLPSAISNNNSLNMNNISGGRRRNNRKTKKSYRNKVSRKSRLMSVCSKRR
jgi:hypothetical protein